MATSSQARCIYALSKQLGTEVDFVEALELPFEAASVKIDQLKKQVDGKNDGEATVDEQWEAVRNWDVRFGMVAKVVMHHYLREEQPFPSSEEFTKRVRSWFTLVNTADKSLRPAPALER